MIVEIDKNLCTGCRECAEVCPAYAIVGEQGQPQTIDESRCVRMRPVRAEMQILCVCTDPWQRRL